MTTRRALQWLVVLTVLASLLGASMAWAQEADILVTKTGPSEAAANTDVSFTIIVTNLGPDASAGVTLTDNVTGGWTFVSVLQNSGPSFICTDPGSGANSGSVVCTNAAMLSGDSAQFTITFHIPPVTPPGTAFTNVATVSSATDPNDENNSGTATVSTPAPPQADVVVTKTGPSVAKPNADVVYTIVVNNAGPGAASTVQMNDILSGGMTFVSISPTGGCTTPAPSSGGTVTCNIAALSAGASVTYTLTVHTPFVSNGTVISNTATVSAATPDPSPENNSSTTELTVSNIDVSVTKTTGSPTVNVGDTISYTLTVSNAGNGEGPTAINVQLSDTLPPNTTFVSLIQNSGPAPDSPCSTPLVGGTGTVSCFFSTLASGASATFTLVIRVGDTTSVTNTVTASTDSPDSDLSNNTASVTTSVNTSADVGVTNSGPATATAGSNLTYTVTVTNAGPSTAADASRASRALAPASTVTLTDVLPPNTTFVSLTQTSGPTFSCATPAVGAGGTITCTIATLAPGASATFVITLRLGSGTAAGTTVSSTATVTSATPDPNPSNNQSTSSTSSTVSADVSVSKTGPAAVAAGATVTYTVVVANAGPSDAASVSLSDPLPAGTTFVSETQTTGPAFGCATPVPGGTGTITCAIATLPAGASATFSIVVNVAAGASGTIANTATVTAATSDPTSANNSATTSAPVTAGADVSVTKTGPSVVASAVNASYSITVANGGPGDAASVSLSDTIPSGTTFVSESQTTGPTFACTTPAAGGTGTITCTIATLPAGASATFSIVVNVSAGTTGTITNTATVTSTTTDPVPSNNSSSTAATVSPGAADLSIAKTASALVAGSVTFTIVVTNNGPALAQGVIVTDILPVGTTLTSVASSQGSCTSGSTVTCAVGTLAVGASATITLKVTILTNTTVANTATVAGASPDPNLVNNSSTVVVGTATIPTLSPPTFALLALVLIVAGFWVLRRRRPASTR